MEIWKRGPDGIMRSDEGRTMYPGTISRTFHGCGHMTIDRCGCLGHEGQAADHTGPPMCPDCQERHDAEVEHEEWDYNRHGGFGRTTDWPRCQVAGCGRPLAIDICRATADATKKRGEQRHEAPHIG